MASAKLIGGSPITDADPMQVILFGPNGSVLLGAAVAAADDMANPTAPQMLAHGMVWDSAGANWDRHKGGAGAAAGFAGITIPTDALSTDGQAATRVTGADGNVRVLAVATALFNGATWDRLRVANVFKPIPATAVTAGTGITIWTPTSGKKFRLMGWCISVTAAAEIIFGDNAVGTVIFRTGIHALNDPGQPASIGNGILSAAANNVLKLDVSANATVQGTVFGTEE